MLSTMFKYLNNLYTITHMKFLVKLSRKINQWKFKKDKLISKKYLKKEVKEELNKIVLLTLLHGALINFVAYSLFDSNLSIGNTIAYGILFYFVDAVFVEWTWKLRRGNQ